MKTDIFNFRRFGKYFASDIKTCWANFGLSLLTITIIIPVVLYLVLTTVNMLLTSSWEGPGMGFRLLAFGVAMLCTVLIMPVKTYGRITEKQYGSFWLTLPASRLEKFISMFLLTCIIVPAVSTIIYLGMDAIICAIDHTCGQNLFSAAVGFFKNMGDIQELTMNFVDENITLEDASLVQMIIDQINSPMLYIDEILQITLPFLLGALYFKSGKTAKTILVIFAFSTVTGIIATPVMERWSMELFDSLNENPNVILTLFDNGFFKNLVLIDTITDAVINIALLTAIWFRIKTLKH